MKSEPVDPDAWEYYTGDPCYVIDDDRWHLFCEALFAVEADEQRKTGRRSDGPHMVPWSNKDGSIEGHVECWSSPGGDGCWSFGSWGSMGVDAGLLAIVPREFCENGDVKGLGILHFSEPSLETTNSHHGAPVILNDRNCDGYDECDECDAIGCTDQMWYCESCGKQTCCGCGCEECSCCGQMFENSYPYRDSHCDDCEQCHQCDKVVERYEYNYHKDMCHDCTEDEEE